EAGQTFTVLRSPYGTYLRLTPAERELWHAMDGSRTVAQLATLGFVRFKQLLPVAELVHTLKIQGFLRGRPVAVYQRLKAALTEKTAEGWGRRLLRALRGYTFAIDTIDRPYSAIYRSVGWVLFTRPFQILHATVSAAGLTAFALMLGQPASQ